MAVKRNYRINLRNYGNPPAIMVSQYDENYALTFEVYDGPLPASGLNVYTVKLVGTRADTLKYSFDGTVTGVANNVLNFTIDTTMTACAGKGVAEIVILDATNDVKFASFNLPVYVEKAAVPDDAVDADVERAQEIADQVEELIDGATEGAEAWAVGQRGGVDVESTDPTYHNNAKYYSEVAQDIADSIGIDATLSVAGKAADAKKTGDEISSLKEDLSVALNDSAVLINSAANKIKSIPLGRSGTAGDLAIEYFDGKVKISGSIPNNNILLEADSDAAPLGTSWPIPYRQSPNSGLFDDNANARKVHVDTGRYRLVYNMLSGTVTKGGVTYTSNADFGSANVVNAFILRPDASSSEYTFVKTNVTQEIELESGYIGIQLLYCYKGCVFNDAVFELYLEKITGEVSPEVNTLQSEIELLCGQSTVENLFRQGGYNREGGSLGSTNRRYYIVTSNYASDDLIKLKASEGYYLTVLAWDSEGVFAGFRNSEDSLTTVATQNVYWAQELWLSKFRELYPELKFKIEIANADTVSGTLSNIVPAEAVNVTAYYIGKDTSINPQYKAELDATVASVHAKITEPALVFPLVTDIHYLSINAFYDDCINNIKAFAENVKCDFILNLGDDTDGNQTQEVTLTRTYYMRKRFNEIDVPYYHAIGNHDTNYYQSHPKLSSDQIYSAYLSNTRGVHFDMTAGEKNFYKDFDELGIRLVVLDGNHNAAYAFSSNTAAWLTNTALVTNYIVVIGVHFSPIEEQNWASKTIDRAPAVAAAIQAFVNGGGTVIQFCGHSHADYSFSTPWLSIHNNCQKFEQSDLTESGFAHLVETTDDIEAPERVEGTATEDCWSVVVIKPVSRTVDVIRFGAGNDRTFDF